MTDLADDQARFVAVLQQGPPAFPEDLFAGDPFRALLGLKTHANTISHARLVALEQTYPRTLGHLGDAAFNALSREFIERDEVRARKLMTIGEGFAEFLADRSADPVAAELAAVEWAWLQSYHAAETPALRLADLAHYDEPGLLNLKVTMHPAAQIVPASGAVIALLPEIGAPDGPIGTILVTRPDETVLLRSLSPAHSCVAEAAKNCGTMGNLLQMAIEQAGEADALPVIFALIEAGALAGPEDRFARV